MKSKLTACALLLIPAMMALPASAQSMRAGLWEITNKMQSPNGEMEQAMQKMQQQMATMPPEQRKMVEDMMAQKGVTLSGTAGGGMVVKTCVSKEMAARNEMPVQQDGNCTMTRTPTGKGSFSVTGSCANPPSSLNGQISFSSDTAYTMTATMSSAAGGQQHTANITTNARWLGADCGAIKPVQTK